MFIWLFKHIIISILLIISVHYIYIFLKTNLTNPKTKDLIDAPKKKYDEIYDSIKKSNNIIDDNIDKDNMKNELKSYLEELTTKQSPFNNSSELYSKY